MKPKYEIVEVKAGRCAKLYTIRSLDSNETEFDKFLEDPRVREDEHFNEFIARLNSITDRHGCIYSFFRDESTRDNQIVAFFHADSNLRLYCLRMKQTLLILGCGGNKSVRTYQEDPELHNCVKLLEDFWEHFVYYEKEGEIEIEKDGTITGQLTI